MPDSAKILIKTNAIIVAYAMSRLDDRFLQKFGFRSWKQAFRETGERLGVRPASMKNLRDEFDPVHANARRGWHKRPLRKNRQRVLGEFCDASDEAVLDIVARLLAGDREVGELITKPLAEAKETVANVAERIRTGKLAEKYFMEHSESICGVQTGSLLDCRDLACGYDFGVAGRQTLAIEVKGMKTLRGAILFSDGEWRQANRRQADYWLVVVGGLEQRPRARLIENPCASLAIKSSIRKVTEYRWTATLTVADSGTE
jgi:hypothetical protein